MKFSIIVPVYNTEKFVGDCIDSVLNQTYDDFELVLVDDGSTDKSSDVCKKYAAADERVLFFRKENSGQIKTRCYGISKSHGDYIVFLDSDDILDCNALRVIAQKISVYRCDMVIYTYEHFFGKPQIYETGKSKDTIISNKKELYIKIFSSEYYNSLCIKAIKRDFLRSDGYSALKNVRYGEDLLQTIDIIRQNPKTVFIEDVLYHYRTNPNSVTRTLNAERYASDIIFVRNAAYECLKSEGYLTDDEMCHFRGISIKLLCEGVSNIAQSKYAFSEKLRLIKGLKSTPYYKDFILGGKYDESSLGNKRPVWLLFKNGFLMTLICIFLLKRRLKER